MIRAAILAVLVAAPSHAGPLDALCRSMAQLAANGAEDGNTMKPILDGLAESMVGAQVSSDDEARIVAASYLSGYSQGLLRITPEQAANEFMTGCMAEGV